MSVKATLEITNRSWLNFELGVDKELTLYIFHKKVINFKGGMKRTIHFMMP